MVPMVSFGEGLAVTVNFLMVQVELKLLDCLAKSS